MDKATLVVYMMVVFLLAANLYMSFQMQSQLNDMQLAVTPKKSLPCESIPLGWAVTHHDCANSLLWAMNVTNVKFDLPGANDLAQYNTSVFTHRS